MDAAMSSDAIPKVPEPAASAGETYAHLPPLMRAGNEIAPRLPVHIEDTGIDTQVLADLALKAAYTVSQLTPDWLARRLHIAQVLAADLLDKLRAESLVETLGQAGPIGFRYSISQ